jgi:RNA polymerase sigma factor (sigma-70 family)
MSITMENPACLTGGHTEGAIDGNSTINDLVVAALDGDERAWGVLHERFTPLISRVCRQFRLFGTDAEDVSQVVWLRLVQHLKHLREPRALPGWIATTAKREALQVVKSGRRTQPVDAMSDYRFDRVDSGDLDSDLERLERAQAVHEALGGLRTEQRELLIMLHAEPKIPYQEISERLGIPIGSIGPTRARCLAKLRATRPVQALFGAGAFSR